ncbi:MAG TPA: hypothetical protein VNU46_04265, partial [Gemmatimonadaceae bacterium]|nr:hypothetical protein [Gemmatimonadaceae bacterium]
MPERVYLETSIVGHVAGPLSQHVRTLGHGLKPRYVSGGMPLRRSASPMNSWRMLPMIEFLNDTPDRVDDTIVAEIR